MALGVGLGFFGAGHRGLHQQLPGRHHQYSHRGGPDPDDVPALCQGALRGTARRIPRQEGARALAGAELDRRAGSDVRAGGDLPARQAGIHGRPHHDRPGPLHCHGDRLERARQGLDRVRRRSGRLQLDLSGAVLQRLCLACSSPCCRRFRADRLRCRYLDRADRRECLHLSGHPLYCRRADARDHAALRLKRLVPRAISCRRSDRSR